MLRMAVRQRHNPTGFADDDVNDIVPIDVYDSEKDIAWADFSLTLNRDETWSELDFSTSVFVEPTYRRHGIATNIYHVADSSSAGSSRPATR